MRLDVVQSGRATWLGHEYTKAQRMKIQAGIDRHLKLLLNACADSSDPNVLRSYGAWRLQERMLAFLGGAEDERNEDGG